MTTNPEQSGPSGFGGWFILPMIGLILTPFSIGIGMVRSYGDIGEWFSFLNAGQKILVGGEMLFNMVFAFGLTVFVLILMFQKRRAFVQAYIFWGIINFAGLLASTLLAGLLFPEAYGSMAELFDGETTRDLVRAAALIAIWIPYMLKSRRVANTFVN